MARSLPATTQNTPPPLSAIEDKLLWYLADGATPSRVAQRLAPDDKRKQASLRVRIYQILDIPHVQAEYARRLRLVMMGNLGAVSKSLARKGRAGRVDASKLIFEVSQFYNPRTEVNHSGEVQITIKGLPRPAPVVDEDSVVDATVVE